MLLDCWVCQHLRDASAWFVHTTPAPPLMRSLPGPPRWLTCPALPPPALQFWVNPVTVVGMLDVLAVPQGEYLLQTAAGSVLGRQVIQVRRGWGRCQGKQLRVRLAACCTVDEAASAARGCLAGLSSKDCQVESPRTPGCWRASCWLGWIPTPGPRPTPTPLPLAAAGQAPRHPHHQRGAPAGACR